MPTMNTIHHPDCKYLAKGHFHPPVIIPSIDQLVATYGRCPNCQGLPAQPFEQYGYIHDRLCKTLIEYTEELAAASSMPKRAAEDQCQS